MTKERKMPRVLRVLFYILFILLALFTINSILSPNPEVGCFKSVEDRQAYFTAYDNIMNRSAITPNVIDVNTSWGVVRVYEWNGEKKASAEPVLLLPGHSSGAPMWNENIEGFSKDRTVYSIDALGDAGKSVKTVPLTRTEDVSEWITEVLSQLQIEQTHIVGHSFGGGYAANFTLHHPEKVKTLTLLEPAFALNFPSFSVLFWASLSGLEFLPKEIRDYGLAQISGEDPSDIASDDPLAQMIAAASSGYSNALPTPSTLTKEELEHLSMPVYVALADHSPITNPNTREKAELTPNSEVKVWKSTTHSLPIEVAEPLANELNAFWLRTD